MLVWKLLYSKLEISLVLLFLPEIIFKKIRELYLVENILYKGSRNTKLNCKLQKGAKRKYITTPFYASGCKFEKMQNTWFIFTEVPSGNGCVWINPEITDITDLRRLMMTAKKNKQLDYLLPHFYHFNIEPTLFT